jgi:xylose isomerase
MHPSDLAMSHARTPCRYSSWHEEGGLGERIRAGQESFESLEQWVMSSGQEPGDHIPSGRQELAELYLSWYV